MHENRQETHLSISKCGSAGQKRNGSNKMMIGNIMANRWYPHFKECLALFLRVMARVTLLRAAKTDKDQ